MEFVVKKPEKIKVTNHDGKVYEVSKPTFAMMEEIASMAELEGRKSFAFMKDCLSRLGLPVEVLNDWDPDTVIEFVDMLIGRKKK